VAVLARRFAQPISLNHCFLHRFVEDLFLCIVTHAPIDDDQAGIKAHDAQNMVAAAFVTAFAATIPRLRTLPQPRSFLVMRVADVAQSSMRARSVTS
jgi:hypothetical protein